MQEHFGEHLTIDGYGGCPIRLDDRAVLASALRDLCVILEMHPLAEAQVVSAPDNQLKDPGGWSAFVIIAESHISIHTFPKRRFLSADVYTCRNGLDVARVGEFFRTAFLLKDIETHFIRRGLDYPARNIA